MKNCIFCKIVNKELPAKILYEDEEIVAFPDIHPSAPVHILVVPKKHIETIDHLEEGDQKIVGQMVMIAQKIAREKKISAAGYRLVFNVKSHGGQIIDHIHLHLLGGQRLGGMV